MRAAPLLLAFLLALGAAPSPACAEDAERTAQRDALVAELEAHAAWAQKRKFFRARNETYELLLHFRPDHAKARKWLKYRRAKDGTWARSPRYKAPRNLKPPGEELETRRRALGERYVSTVQAWMETKGASLSRGQRAAVIRELVLVAPWRADLREAQGETLTAEGRWMLAASLRAPARRAALAEAAKDALERAPAASTVRPGRADNAAGLAWKAILEGPRVRVLGTVSPGELMEAHRIGHAASDVFRSVYGVEAPPLPRLELILITSNEERETLLKKHPKSTPAFQKFGATLSSGWFPKSATIFARHSLRNTRLEWCARQPLGGLLRKQFKVRSKHGWAFEGFGLYVSYLLSGQRSTFYVRRTKYDDGGNREGDLWDKLKEDGADWRAHARTLLASPQAPDLRLLLGKEVNTMNTEDLLVSYVLAAFVIEGYPDRIAPLLKAVAAGGTPDEIIAKGLDLDVDGLGQRLRRWLEETAPAR